MTEDGPRLRRFLIGTAGDCRFRITDDPYVSTHHVAVWQNVETGEVWATDLGSTNGTTLVRAGQRVPLTSSVRIYPGDTLVVGRTVIPWTP